MWPLLVLVLVCFQVPEASKWGVDASVDWNPVSSQRQEYRCRCFSKESQLIRLGGGPKQLASTWIARGFTYNPGMRSAHWWPMPQTCVVSARKVPLYEVCFNYAEVNQGIDKTHISDGVQNEIVHFFLPHYLGQQRFGFHIMSLVRFYRLYICTVFAKPWNAKVRS